MNDKIKNIFQIRLEEIMQLLNTNIIDYEQAKDNIINDFMLYDEIKEQLEGKKD